MTVRAKQYLAAALFGALLLLAQLGMIYQHFGMDLANPKAQLMQRQLLDRLTSDGAASSAVVGYLLAALTAHVGLAVLALAVFRAVAAWLRVGWLVRWGPASAFVLLAVLVLSMWNRLLFPSSRAFEAVELLMVQAASPLLLWGGTVVVVTFSLIAITSLLVRSRIALICVVALLGFTFVDRANPSVERVVDQPDIIILGVDSLRPDFIPAYGFPGRELTPAINGLLDEMVVFDDAITPLARTFVSYTSTLTGKNPSHHGARFNLYPRSEFSQRETLAWELRGRGYRTALAMDESRFANFSGTFGFDDLLVPSEGALDFLVGANFDLLATNMLLKIPGIKQMFPHVYGNRAAYRTYQLKDHPERVSHYLDALPSTAPLFFLSHLCLPHWPYVSGGLFDEQNFDEIKRTPGYEDAPERYVRSLVEVDKQFDAVVNKLRQTGRMRNAIVVLMSDHGEGFSMKRDILWDVADSNLGRTFFGHGSFALSDKQSHVVLGLQRYVDGVPQWQNKRVKGNVSLIDVAPTLMAALEGEAKFQMEGISLLAAIERYQELEDRPRFVESGLRSLGVEKAEIDEGEVASEMAHLYQVLPDLRFEIKPEYVLKHLANKQRGVLFGSLGVTTYPVQAELDDAQSCWQVVDYDARTLRCAAFPDSDPAVASMQQMVCTYFEGDAGFGAEWCDASHWMNHQASYR